MFMGVATAGLIRALLFIVSLQSGCAFLFVKGSSTNHATVSCFDRSGSNAWPVVDLILAGLDGLNAGSATSDDMDPNQDVVVYVAVLVISGISAIYCFSKARKYRDARRQRDEWYDPAGIPAPGAVMPAASGIAPVRAVPAAAPVLAAAAPAVAAPAPAAAPAPGSASPARTTSLSPSRSRSNPPVMEVGRPPNVPMRPSVHQTRTVMMSLTETKRLLRAARPEMEVDVPTDPCWRAAGNMPEPGTIYARYLCGDSWVPSRIGTLSLKGAALMAGELPRVADRIDIMLAYADYRALVRGVVEKISTMQEAATSGMTTFNVNFELDDGSRQELTALLTIARSAKVTFKPPPPRRTRRYSFAWPIRLGSVPEVVLAKALDVSTGGMFVRTLRALTLDANVTFTAVLDDGLAPVSGRSRVVRNQGDGEAKAVGRSPGYWLSIVKMAKADHERWSAFVLRIARRSARRILIGAAPARLAELQRGLEAAGYVVTGSSVPSTFVRHACAAAHPVDAALIDASWLATASSTRIEPLVLARGLPSVTVHGDAKRARIAVDQLLALV
jgi:hypothetical protein